jgi:putative DNA primase/helicase
MTDALDPVKAVFDAPEDVDIPEGMEAPHPSDDARAYDGPDADPYDGLEPDYSPDFAPAGPVLFDPEKLRLAVTYPINDLGNSQRFVLHNGDDVRNVPRVGWHVWDQKVWAIDPDWVQVRKMAQALSAQVEAEVPYLILSDDKMDRIRQKADLLAEKGALELQRDDGGKLSDVAAGRVKRIEYELMAVAELEDSLSKLRRGHRTFARSTGNSAKIKAALTEAEVPLSVAIEALDTRPMDVNTETGVLRFSVTPRAGSYPEARVELVDHDRGLLMTKIMAAGYVPGATAPMFQRFLGQIQPDPLMQGFLQRWFGYSMLGLTNEQALAFFFGMGANGKSALVDLMARVMGSYAATAKIESLTGQNRKSGSDATPDLIAIVAARMVRAAEPEKGVQWQEGLIKQLTGGEPILVRQLNMPFFETTPKFKLTISGNDAPDIRGMDDGIWRRLMIVPFEVQIPKEDRDPLIVQRMMAEASGILNWMVEGALQYLEQGLSPPAQISQATQDLRADADPYGKFLESCCVVSGDARDSIASADLKNAFAYWQQFICGVTPFKDKTIQMAMKDHSRRWRSVKTGRQFTARETGRFNGYDGLKFTDFFAEEYDLAPKDSSGRRLSRPESVVNRRDYDAPGEGQHYDIPDF